MGHFTRPHGMQPIDPVEGAQRLADIRGRGSVRLTGGVRHVGHDRIMVTPCSIQPM
jgi:hypothetical protein